MKGRNSMKYPIIDEPLSKDNPIQNIPLNQFIDSGLLVLVNQFLHTFGFALAYDCDQNGKPDDNSLRPVRTTFRGFSEEVQTRAYTKITNYMIEHANELKEDLDK
jgi:hypothetical protein